MRVTQGTFSFLPDLTNAQITAQLQYCLDRGWAISVETTDDPHPRNTFWEMFGMPMFDIHDAAGVMMEIESARKTFPNHYIRVMAFDSTHTVESVVISFLVNRPKDEPGFRLVRQEINGRQMRYSTESYAVNRSPEGSRY